MIPNNILFPLFRFYWFLFRPASAGAKCIIFRGENILMVRNAYGRMRWTFPGGSLEKGESPEEAVRREIFEETGIKLNTVQSLGSFLSTAEYKKDTVHCFMAHVENEQVTIDTQEILEARWFSLNDLPEMGPIAKKILEMAK